VYLRPVCLSGLGFMVSNQSPVPAFSDMSSPCLWREFLFWPFLQCPIRRSKLFIFFFLCLMMFLCFFTKPAHFPFLSLQAVFPEALFICPIFRGSFFHLFHLQWREGLFFRKNALNPPPFPMPPIFFFFFPSSRLRTSLSHRFP